MHTKKQNNQAEHSGLDFRALAKTGVPSYLSMQILYDLNPFNSQDVSDLALPKGILDDKTQHLLRLAAKQLNGSQFNKKKLGGHLCMMIKLS